jgi:cytidylate kinase
MEGRDIGTVVFPEAPVKVFLNASSEVRARRRHAETESESAERVADSMARRDEQDRSRGRSPLVPARDALVIDTTDLSFETVVGQVVEAALRAGFEAGSGTME